MDLNDNSENAEYEIKIFQIDKSFFEFKKHNLQNNEQIINYIINEHRIKVKDIENYNKKIVPVLIDDVDYFTYVYNEEEKDAFWKKWLFA